MMKKCLFYTFLFIFFVTAVVTLLGITKVFTIEDKYLTPLYLALLIELVVTVTAVYRKTDFFDDAKDKSIESISVAGSNISSSNTTIQEPLIKQPISQTQDQLLNIDDYFNKLESLDGRFKEQSNLRKETNGKTVVFSGTVYSVSDWMDGAMIICNQRSGGIVCITLPSSKKEDAYSLQKGDLIKTHGIINTTSLIIDSDNFERLQLEGSTSTDKKPTI